MMVAAPTLTRARGRPKPAHHWFTKITPRAAIYFAMLDRANPDTVRPAPKLRLPWRSSREWRSAAIAATGLTR